MMNDSLSEDVSFVGKADTAGDRLQRCCWDETKEKGSFIGRCLAWGDVPGCLSAKGKQYLALSVQNGAHAVKWRDWVSREEGGEKTKRRGCGETHTKTRSLFC